MSGATGRSGSGVLARWPRAVALGVGLVAALLLAELALRVIGFSFYLYPTRVEFGWPTPEVIEELFEPEPDLFWVPRDYRAKLSQAAQAPPRVVFMGDSCTQFANFDRRFAALVARRRRRELSTLNLAAAGWTSYQGRVQLARDVLPLAPASVVIYYGWNDHWVGFGLEDAELARITGSRLYALQELRVVQLLLRALVGGARSSWDPGRAGDPLPRPGEAELPLRVPPSRFRENLSRMVETARAAGIVPMLVTAPSGHLRGEEPRKLAVRHLQRLDDLVPLHQRYVQTVREVARALRAPLCDLARLLDPPRDGSPRGDAARLFWDDGIHLSEDGAREVGRALFRCYQAQGLLEPGSPLFRESAEVPRRR